MPAAYLLCQLPGRCKYNDFRASAKCPFATIIALTEPLNDGQNKSQCFATACSGTAHQIKAIKQKVQCLGLYVEQGVHVFGSK